MTPSHDHPSLDDMTDADILACDECALIAHDAACTECHDNPDINPIIARIHTMIELDTNDEPLESLNMLRTILIPTFR